MGRVAVRGEPEGGRLQGGSAGMQPPTRRTGRRRRRGPGRSGRPAAQATPWLQGFGVIARVGRDGLTDSTVNNFSHFYSGM